MGEVVKFVRPVARPEPRADDFDAIRFRYIASLAGQFSTLLANADSLDDAAIAELTERARTIIVGIASMEPAQDERQKLQEMMRRGLPRSA